MAVGMEDEDHDTDEAASGAEERLRQHLRERLGDEEGDRAVEELTGGGDDDDIEALEVDVAAEADCDEEAAEGEEPER